jgi:hypothetical protein
MRKQITEYTSDLDALIAVTKQLSGYEIQYHMASEEFFAQYKQGKTADGEVFVEWANNYQHYLVLHQDVESQLKISRNIVIKI